jgi:hypothetical protein
MRKPTCSDRSEVFPLVALMNSTLAFFAVATYPLRFFVRGLEGRGERNTFDTELVAKR